jgi:uncharacterized protein YegJ (DUF2314 family)
MRPTPKQFAALFLALAIAVGALAALALAHDQALPGWGLSALALASLGTAIALWRNPKWAAEQIAALFTAHEDGQWIDPSDPLFRHAQSRARQSLERMRALHVQHPGEVMVKFAWTTDAGAVERVWGEVVQADGDTLVVRMLSRPIAQTAALPGTVRVPANEIDDWALHLPDEVHGGFSVQAEMRLAQRAGRPVPSHIEQMKGRFRDPLLG